MPAPAAAPKVGPVLTKAVLRAARALGLTQRRLASILGLSEATVSRLGRAKTLDARTKDGELAVLFVRMFRSLDTVVGGDERKARAWLWAENDHLSGIPADRIRTIAGLLDVVSYLDAVRGKL
jgi:transcriptional regulator with XRE-family HTH domain